jgi:hypothetical protein
MFDFHNLDGVRVFALMGMFAIVVEFGYSLLYRPTAQNKRKQREHKLLYDKGLFLHGLRLSIIAMGAVILFRAANDQKAPGFALEFAPIMMIVVEVLWLYVLLRTRPIPDQIYGTPDGLLILRRDVADIIPYDHIDRIDSKKMRDEYVLTLHFKNAGKFGSAIRFTVGPQEQETFFTELANCKRRADYLRERHPPREDSGARLQPALQASPKTAQQVTSTAYLLTGIIGLAVSAALFLFFSDAPFAKFLPGEKADRQEEKQSEAPRAPQPAGKENEAASSGAPRAENESRQEVEAFFANAKALQATLQIGAPFAQADFERRIAAQNGEVARYENFQHAIQAIQAMEKKRYAVHVALIPAPNDPNDFTCLTWFRHQDRHVLYGFGVRNGRIASKRVHENGAWRDLP